MRELGNDNAAYIAGIVDGEGYIGVAKTRNRLDAIDAVRRRADRRKYEPAID